MASCDQYARVSTGLQCLQDHFMHASIACLPGTVLGTVQSSCHALQVPVQNAAGCLVSTAEAVHFSA